MHEALKQIEHRLTVLETEMAAAKDSRRVIWGKLDDIKECVEAIKLQTELARAHACPTPGGCLPLKAEVLQLRADVDPLKNYIAAQKGGWKAITVVATVACTLGGAAATLGGWIASHLRQP